MLVLSSTMTHHCGFDTVIFLGFFGPFMVAMSVKLLPLTFVDAKCVLSLGTLFCCALEAAQLGQGSHLGPVSVHPNSAAVFWVLILPL